MVRQDLVQLVKAPLPPDSVNCLRSGAYPPHNLTSIATSLKERTEIVPEIIDGEIFSLDEIIRKIGGGIVGISSTSLAYPTALQIAEAAKEKGGFVVLGGVHAFHLPEKVAQNRPYLDVVVHGQGEGAFTQLVLGDNLEEIPNITYRNKGEVQKNEDRFTKIGRLLVPDFSLVSNLDEYFANFRKHYGYKRENGKGLPVFSSSGCLYRIKTGGCDFCSIPDTPYSLVDPDKYWENVRKLQEQFGVNLIWDISDTFTSARGWVRRVAESKPDDISVAFNIYGRVDDLDQEMLGYLTKIGVSEILLGVESFCDGTLQSVSKGFTSQQAIDAVRLLGEYGINVELSLVLGNYGETEESLRTTLETCERLQELDNIDENHSSILIPLPGSRVFNRLMDIPEMKEKYGGDLIDYASLQIDFLDKFTECGADKVFEYYNKIEGLFTPAGPFYSPANSRFYREGRFRDDL